jgi:twitching motility protein PilT
VILVGEMRDLETIETAILAAETGHLVMSTLHTLERRRRSRASSACSPSISATRRGSSSPSVIRGVVSQRLIPRADGLGMVPAVEC